MRKNTIFDRIFFSLLSEGIQIDEEKDQQEYYAKKKELSDKHSLQLQQAYQKFNLQMNSLRRKHSLHLYRLKRNHQQKLRDLSRRLMK